MIETILLTATIDPGGVPIHIKDPVERLTQYAISLLCWIREGPFDQIVLCDNSGYTNLEPLRRIAAATNRKVEIISFKGNHGSLTKGKGYGEAEIMEHAFRHSALIRSSWSIWKVTGRLYVPNAAKVQEVHHNDRHVMTSDTRYFKISQNFFWCHLHPHKEALDDNRPEGNIESVYGHVIAAMSDHYIQVFREPIELVGQGGGSGMWYGPYPKWAVEEARQIISSASPTGG